MASSYYCTFYQYEHLGILKQLNELVEKVQDIVNIIFDYFEENNLTCNTDMTQVAVLKSKKQSLPQTYLKDKNNNDKETFKVSLGKYLWRFDSLNGPVETKIKPLLLNVKSFQYKN